MTQNSWRDLWHRAQDGEMLSAHEQVELEAALQDPEQQRETQRWAAAGHLLSRAETPPMPRSLSAEIRRDIQAQQVLSAAAPPALPHSLAAEVLSDITISRWFDSVQQQAALPRSVAFSIAARIAEDGQPKETDETDPLAQLLRQWPKPELPRSLAFSLAARVAAEAAQADAPADAPTPQTPIHETLPPLGRTRLNPPGGPSGLGGLGVVLAFGGLTVLRGNEAARSALGLLGSAAPFALPLPALLGVAVLALLSWLIVARPTPAVQRLGTLAFAMTGVLTLPALWDAIQNTPLQGHLTALSAAHPKPNLLLERWLGAGLLLAVTALLLRGGWGASLARTQRRAPIRTLAAGTLAGLGLSGLGLLLLSFGWTDAGLVLALLSGLAALTGLSVSVYAAGRSVARKLHLALPDISGPLAGLLAFSATLSIPALAASLAIVGSAWGLGTLLLGRGTARF
ncbi:hypothetical protein EHF33_06480 [Deinococcus psychrotolerans]|uniref:Uncharacterized protein n=1 Tax=Deinococcus psychrotolerans TaxID=2489213 RepID=A0A3G8YMR2_9DEIO|nr:hypothetical protein [Deinococcus psychrotolerans]AZI42436.1 hypothetical protein EHF33_06480 [Deinococcus psychrotolerans]